MSLLNVNDIEPEKLATGKSFGFIEQADNDCTVYKHYQAIDEVVNDIRCNTNIHFACMVEWSMHELLDYLLKLTGPAKVYIATWSISEEAARYLTELVNKRQITELFGLFDFRSTNRHPEAFHLAKQSVSMLRLYPVHAKVTCIVNDDWQICINGSANYTNKKRIEAGVISVNNGVAIQHINNWLMPMIEKGVVFE